MTSTTTSGRCRRCQNFAIVDLSAFYFDIRKDTLYCEPASSLKRRAALTVIDEIFRCLTAWLAPILCFTAEEAWLSRHPSDDGSVHLEEFPKGAELLARRGSWRRNARQARHIRRAVTGALEIERREKRIGSPASRPHRWSIIDDEDVAPRSTASTCRSSSSPARPTLKVGKIPKDAFRLDEVRHVGVEPKLAQGKRCERSWRIVPDVGDDKDYPTLSARDAAAMRERDASV